MNGRLAAVAGARQAARMDLGALLAAGQLDRAMVERLRDADKDAMRESLSKYHDDAEVERIMGRIEELIAALPKEP